VVNVHDAIVKMRNEEVIKISMCKEHSQSESGTLIIENHLGEKYLFSPYNFLYAKFIPADEKVK